MPYPPPGTNCVLIGMLILVFPIVYLIYCATPRESDRAVQEFFAFRRPRAQLSLWRLLLVFTTLGLLARVASEFDWEAPLDAACSTLFYGSLLAIGVAILECVRQEATVKFFHRSTHRRTKPPTCDVEQQRPDIESAECPPALPRKRVRFRSAPRQQRFL